MRQRMKDPKGYRDERTRMELAKEEERLRMFEELIELNKRWKYRGQDESDILRELPKPVRGNRRIRTRTG